MVVCLASIPPPGVDTAALVYFLTLAQATQNYQGVHANMPPAFFLGTHDIDGEALIGPKDFLHQIDRLQTCSVRGTMQPLVFLSPSLPSSNSAQRLWWHLFEPSKLPPLRFQFRQALGVIPTGSTQESCCTLCLCPPLLVLLSAFVCTLFAA